MKRNYLIYALLMTVFLSSNVISAQNYFGDFPVKADPKTVGNKLSRRLMETKHQLYFDRGIHYAEVCTWYGALRFAELTNNKESDKAVKKPFRIIVSSGKRTSTSTDSRRPKYVWLLTSKIL